MHDAFISLLFTCFALSIFPVISFGIADNAEDDKSFTDYFGRPDSATYFTNLKLIQLRKDYDIEFRQRAKSALIFIFLWLLIFSSTSFLGARIGVDGGKFLAFNFLLSWGYLVGSIYFFGRLGASAARRNATRPLNKYQREVLEQIIKDSPRPKLLVEHINRNPKNTLAYIDVLNLKYQAKKILKNEKDKLGDQALSGLIK